MIIKSIPVKGRAFSQLLNYMFNSGDRLTDAQGCSFMLKRNLRGKDTEALIKEFHLNESFREVSRANSNNIYHEIISFSDEDTPNLTIDILKDITEAYINLRAPNALVVATPHFDQTHRHVHLAISGIQYRTGIATRITKQGFHTIKEQLQNLQQERYPHLHHSIVEHGKKAKEAQKIKKSETKERKDLVVQLESLMATSTSREDFFSKLSEAGIQSYTRGDNIKGIEHGGKRYRFSTLGIEGKLQEWDNPVSPIPLKEPHTQEPIKSTSPEVPVTMTPATPPTQESPAPLTQIPSARSQELRSIRHRGNNDRRRTLSDRDQDSDDIPRW